jgi:hypothetical protein
MDSSWARGYLIGIGVRNGISSWVLFDMGKP